MYYFNHFQYLKHILLVVPLSPPSISRIFHLFHTESLYLLNSNSVTPHTSLPAASQFSSVPFSCSVVSNSLRPHGLQHARPPCPSPTPRVYSNSCLLSRWCHPTISSFVVPFSSRLQSFPASGSFPMSQFFAPADQSIGISSSASVLPMYIQDILKTPPKIISLNEFSKVAGY